MNPRQVVAVGAFDDLRARDLRFLEEVSRHGDLTVLLWNDDLAQRFQGRKPKFPEAERLYFLRAVRYVRQVHLVAHQEEPGRLPEVSGFRPDLWAVRQSQSLGAPRTSGQADGIQCVTIEEDKLSLFPGNPAEPPPPAPGRKRVVVTGCYDWFHSGHVRFFEEVSAYGDLFVIVGHDANIRLLKGEGHPLLPQEERRYVAGSIRYVTQALVSSGDGWLDADPEINRLKPDLYAVNEDGDKGGKREYCQKLGLEYLVLKRTPAPGLPKRSSTDLRGF